MKLFLLIGAALSGLFGLAFGIMSVLLMYSATFGDAELSMLGMALPLICISAIGLIVAVRYFKHPNYESARGIAGMTGFAVWSISNPVVHILRPEDGPWSMIVPLIGGIIVYRLLLIPIRRAFPVTQAEPDEACNADKPSGDERSS